MFTCENVHVKLFLRSTLTVAVLLYALSAAGCKGKTDSSSEEKKKMVVEFVQPKVQSVIETVMLTGTVKAENRSMVAANTGGKVVDWYVDVGDRVKKGQVMMRLETSALSAQYQQAKAQLDIARQQLDIARKGARPEQVEQLKEQESAALTAFQTTEDNFYRQKKMFEDGVIPQSAYEQALAAKDAAKAQLENIRLSLKMAQNGARPEDLEIAKLSVEAAQSQVNALGATIGYASIRAPFDGIVNSRNRETGEFAGMGDPLIEIIGDGPRKIVVDVPATLITQLSNANSLTAILADERRNAYIIKTYPAVNEMTRTGIIEVGLTNESDLVVGGFVEMEFASTLADNVQTLPRICVQDVGNNPYVWVATDSGKVVKTNVTVGAASRHLFEIKSGLSGSEKVLITGMSLVSAEGEYEVRPYDTTQDGAEYLTDGDTQTGGQEVTDKAASESSAVPDKTQEKGSSTDEPTTEIETKTKDPGNDGGDGVKTGGTK